MGICKFFQRLLWMAPRSESRQELVFGTSANILVTGCLGGGNLPFEGVLIHPMGARKTSRKTVLKTASWLWNVKPKIFVAYYY